MSQYELKFLGTYSEAMDSFIQVKADEHQQITIRVDNPDSYPSVIDLDLATAVRFSKELRKQIGLIKQSQNHG